MRETTEVNYDLMSPQANFSLAHRNQLIPFYPITPYLEKLFRKYKTVSFNLPIDFSDFIPAENIHSSERSL